MFRDHGHKDCTVDKLKKTRYYDASTLDHLKQVLDVYKKRFPVAMISPDDGGQEGLHRMAVAGDKFGWDHKFPVLVVNNI